MEGKINEHGTLEIKRAGQFRKMDCRFGGMDHMANFKKCNHFCSKFGEPKHPIYKLGDNPVPGDKSFSEPLSFRKTSLKLCGGDVLIFDKFTDER